MSTPYPDARTWAQEHSLADVPRLARLEGFAFQAHPEIVASFGADGAAMARFTAEHRRTPERTAKNVLVAVLGIVMVLAPILGVAIYGTAAAYIAPSAGPLPAQVAVPIAGVCFLIAALTQVALWIVWLRGGARWSPLLLGLAVIAAVLAGFATAGIPRVSARDDFAFGAWIVPVWVTLVLGGVLAIGILLRVRVRTPEPTSTAATAAPAAPAVSDSERARTLVRALPAGEQGALQADRDDALRILAGRGLIDDATLQRALGTDLGTLFTLDPIREG